MLSRFLLALSLTLCTLSARAEDVPALSPDRALVIEGIIMGNNLEVLGQKMLFTYAEKSTDPVDIVINSPGGDIVSGRVFISYMERTKEKGVTIRCYVPTLAASMAFSILTHCNERYTLDTSFLLWHRARSTIPGGAISGPEAAVVARDLYTLDNEILRELHNTLHMAPKDVTYHFNHETLHTGLNLSLLAPRFITSVASVDGLLETLANKKVPRNFQPPPFFFGQYVYIAPGVIFRKK